MCNGDRSQVGGKALCGWMFALGKGFWTWDWLGKNTHQGTVPAQKSLLWRWDGKWMERCRGWLFPETNLRWVTNEFVGRGKPVFPSSVQPCVFAHPVTGGPSLGARKNACYSFVKVFSSRAEADRGWRKSLLGDPFLKYEGSISISSSHAREWGMSQDINIICRQ